MLDKKKISKIICIRCKKEIGNRDWTLSPSGNFVCAINCDGMHPTYEGK